MPVQVPHYPVQRRIAAILGAYDDLIEVNRRRIAVLEEMARRLFDEWFVRFRFPGHEGHKMVETEHGRLPEGWDVTPIGEAFSMTGGGTPSKEAPAFWENGTISWYTPTDLTGARTTFMDASKTSISEEGLRRSSAQLFPAGCVMMTSRATIGAIAINTTPASTNQGFITCFPNKRAPKFFMFHWLRQNVELFIANANGATFKEITKGVFKRLPIVLPAHALVDRYEAAVDPIMNLILVTERAQRRLAASRDLLLPRLISGDLSVVTAERELETAA